MEGGGGDEKGALGGAQKMPEGCGGIDAEGFQAGEVGYTGRA